MGVNASCHPDSTVGPHTYITTLTMPQSSSLTGSNHSPFTSSSHQSRADKKRRLASLATLRKKLALRRRRSSKSCDHARVIRDLLQDWSLREIATLVEEYEASAALKDLSVQADLARPPAPTFKQDLSDLFDYKYCTDVDLVFQGAVFPVHRALLSARCPYFQEMLCKIPGYGAQIAVDIRTPGIDIPTFSALLRYLYTGEFNPYDGTSREHDTRLSDEVLLKQLSKEFGTPNSLECDLRYLLDSGDYADCVLVFSLSSSSSSAENNQYGTGCGAASHCSPEPHPGLTVAAGGGTRGSSVGGDSSSLSGGHSSDYGFHNRLEVYCHKAILSSRSPFFRSLIQRRQRYTEDAGLCSVNAVTPPTRIVLDEGVIPKKYARVLLQAMYLDTLDLTCILRDSMSSNSLSEAQSMAMTGRAHLTTVEEAMEVYQIGRFLELDILTQMCEDLIVESLSLENLVSVLHWSRQSYGSDWVERQALHYLREEFSQVAQSPVLLELDKQTLVHALSSDFLQATELEVLQAVLRWGEHQLMRRMEQREPNLVSQTAHSVTRKGLRKRDLNDVELREILSELLPHVRMDHVLPPTHETLCHAIKRGLVSTPPSHMIGADTTNYRINAWIRGKNNGLFVKPRLFTPYAEEVKSVLDEQASAGVPTVRLPCYVSHIPDTLYMVDQHRTSGNTASTVDLVPSTVPVPEPELLAGMVRRERELTASAGYQRAAGLLFADKRMLRRRVRLRVVREFNMPDTVAEVLENATYNDESAASQPAHHCRVRVRDEGRSRLQPPPEFIADTRPDPLMDRMTAFIESEPPLSDVVPDVALASSSLSALHLSSMCGASSCKYAPPSGRGTESWRRRGSGHYHGHCAGGRINRHGGGGSPAPKHRTSASLETLEQGGLGGYKCSMEDLDHHSTMALDLVDSSVQYSSRGSTKSSNKHQRTVPPAAVPLPQYPPSDLPEGNPAPNAYTLKHPCSRGALSLHHYATLNPRHHGHQHSSNLATYTPPPVFSQSSLQDTGSSTSATPPMFL